MVKKISCITFALLFACMTFFSFGFESKASDTMVGSNLPSYYLPYPEPETSANQGYLTVVDKYGSTNTYFWTFHVGNSPAGTISAEITSETTSGHETHLRLGAYGLADSDTEVGYTVYKYDNQGRITLLGFRVMTGMCLNPGPDIIGAKVGGNTYFNTNYYTHKFNVYFDSSGSSALLYDIITKLNTSNNYSSSMSSTLNSLLNECDTVEEQLSSVCSYLGSIKSLLTDIEGDLDVLLEKYDELIAEQKKSNTWLEKIFNYLNESQEKQKEQAQIQGDSSTSDGMNAIEDKGGDFSSSLGNLVGAMSNTGTNCSWTFPEVKMPAIPGVMDSFVLIPSQEINFSAWVNQIPSGVLLLIRSVFTAALVVYCFKELYGTIEYVLTLRKGGGSDE